MDNKDDYQFISGIQHFVYCIRRWALIYIESQWDDNVHTISGQLTHTRAHNPLLTEKRGNLIISRNMPVFSHSLGVRGVCDVVEFRRDDKGVSLYGEEGLWLPCPIEYKLGGFKTIEADSMQLCAQAMCLEDMLLCPQIHTAYIFYSKSKRRESVSLDENIRNTVRNIVNEMYDYFTRNYTPRVKSSKKCTNCSLNDVCLPKLPKQDSVSKYIQKTLTEDNLTCESF